MISAGNFREPVGMQRREPVGQAQLRGIARPRSPARPAEISTPVAVAAGTALSSASAMAPVPVPRSRMRHSPSALRPSPARRAAPPRPASRCPAAAPAFPATATAAGRRIRDSRGCGAPARRRARRRKRGVDRGNALRRRPTAPGRRWPACASCRKNARRSAAHPAPDRRYRPRQARPRAARSSVPSVSGSRQPSTPISASSFAWWSAISASMSSSSSPIITWSSL